MFVPYSSDHCVDSRPWLGYLLFPAFVAASFYLAVEGTLPETRRMLFISLVDIGGLALFVHMIVSFFYLWTTSKAVCSKIGNCLYVVVVAISAGIGIGLLRGLSHAFDEQMIWLLSWLVHGLAGMFLIFFPMNSVEFFIAFPPFRTFSFTGLTTVIFWLLADSLFCILLGWGPAIFLHPASFIMGILSATLLLKIPFISEGVGDRTLWQWIKGQAPEADLAWKDSWSEKKKKKEIEDLKVLETDLLLEQKEKESIRHSTELQEPAKVLCQCGNIVLIPAGSEGKQVKCAVCSHKVRASK